MKDTFCRNRVELWVGDEPLPSRAEMLFILAGEQLSVSLLWGLVVLVTFCNFYGYTTRDDAAAGDCVG